LHEEFDPTQPPAPDHVLAAIRRANAAVRELTAWSGEDRVIAGTTLTGVALVVEHPEADPRWMVFNLGDSRVYRWNAAATAQRLTQLSVDHSLVQELFDAGVIDAERTRTHPDRNVITRALGAADQVVAESWMLPATQSQTFLLCSDGLTKELDDDRIAEVIAEGDLGSAADRLLAAALEAGGHDNVTIVLVSAEYRGAVGLPEPRFEQLDEQTRDRALSPELEDTLPRL
jgi:serine/threonine protein phosphatase PrpC